MCFAGIRPANLRALCSVPASKAQHAARARDKAHDFAIAHAVQSLHVHGAGSEQKRLAVKLLSPYDSANMSKHEQIRTENEQSGANRYKKRTEWSKSVIFQ